MIPSMLLMVLLCGGALAEDAVRAPTVADPRADHALLPTLADWVDRAVSDYALEGFSPYRATAALLDRDGWHVEATMGAITIDQGWRTRPARVEVVVGSPGLDSTRFQAPGIDPVTRPRFVIDDHPLAVARDLWLTTDASFKDAVKQFQVKSAALGALGSTWPDDWSEAPAITWTDDRPPPDIDDDVLRAIALEGSDRLRAVGGLRNGEVKASAMSGRYVLATSEGTRLVQPESVAVVYAWADVVRPDGVQVYEYRQWVADSVTALPDRAVIVAEIEALGRRVAARSEVEPVTYYEGPVVFEGDAAADLFRYLAVPELLGTPPDPRPGRTYEQVMRDQARIGRRLLQPGWRIVDDPTRAPDGMAGGYRYDREGVAARRVELVEDGWVRDVLMSRVPRHDRAASTGHARGALQGTWSARESVLTVTPDRSLSDRRFDAQVSRLMKETRSDRVLVVRALERGRGRGLPDPTDAVWRYADGREEPVLALDLTLDDRRILRDIVAAGGGMHVRPYLAPDEPTRPAQGFTGIPAVIVAPERVLVSELEAVFPGGTVEPPVLTPPPL